MVLWCNRASVLALCMSTMRPLRLIHHSKVLSMSFKTISVARASCNRCKRLKEGCKPQTPANNARCGRCTRLNHSPCMVGSVPWAEFHKVSMIYLDPQNEFVQKAMDATLHLRDLNAKNYFGQWTRWNTDLGQQILNLGLSPNVLLDCN
jgi:hypothetical protein